MTYDYIIIGAGAAGCVLANRLSEDPGISVLLVEDGGAARSPLHSAPRAFYYAMRRPGNVHRYATHAAPGIPAESWLRGRGLGGSTSINGMMYIRGSTADFNALEGAGNPGWGATNFHRAYRELEQHVSVSVPPASDDVAKALLASADALGVPVVSDFNASDGDRISLSPASIANGRRVSAATAFLRPARRRPNLTVATRTRALRVVLNHNRATGAVLRRGSHTEVVRAAREVIVCAGAVESPLLLERSGIGRSDVLAAANIEQAVESPQVGENLIEHRGISMQVRFNATFGLTERLNSSWRQAREAVKYVLTRRGPIATSGYDVVSAFRSSPEEQRPDTQGIWVPIAIDENADNLTVAPYSGVLFTGYALRPTSAGSVHLDDSDGNQTPRIEPNYLESPAEQHATVAALRWARELIASSALANSVESEVFPGSALTSPDQIVAHSRAHGGGIYHAVGSCAMGPSDQTVVDQDLRVRGIERLRVVDASALPFHLSGNTAAPVMATAWLAADRIIDGH